MSLDKLTNDELLALKRGDISQIPTEKLQALKQAEIERSAKVVDEMHPGLSFADRAIVKNFASSPESTIAYLQKKHPDMIFRNMNGDVQVRGKNEKDYHVLDPSSFDLQDLTDIGSDIGQGVVEGVGGAAAGISTMNPAAGYAAAAGIGAASEAAKQGMGSALGIPDNMDAGNIALSGLVSGAAPLVAKGAKSVYSGAKNIAPKVASYMSGIDEDIIKNINIDAKARDFISNVGIDKFLEEKSKAITGAIKGKQNQLGQNLDATMGKEVDIRSAKDKVLDMLRGAQGPLTPFQQKEASVIGSHFDGLQGPSLLEQLGGQKSPINVPPAQVRSIRNSMYDYIGQDGVPYSQQKVAGEGYSALKDAMENASVDKGAFNNANDAYSDFLRRVNSNNNLKTFVSDSGFGNDKSKKLEQLLVDNYKKYNVNQMPQKHAIDDAFNLIGESGGGDMKQLSRELSSHNIFSDPKVLPKDFITGGKAAGIGSTVGGGIAYLGGGGYSTAVPAMILGGIGGEAAASPWMIKRVAEKTLATENAMKNAVKGINGMSPYILKSAPKSIYNLMDNREN